MKILNDKEWLAALEAAPASGRSYHAMFSSWVGGIVKDLRLMMVPLDDHLVHRGDGVFEAMKWIEGQVYLLDPHLERLQRSASFIGLKPFESWEKMKACILETARIADVSKALVRTFLGRGPGSFSANPYDSLGSQFYVVIEPWKELPATKYQNGVSIGLSQIPVKLGAFAQIKSCNYLQNVLMKKESVDRGLDFTIGVTPDGWITEGSTENLAIVNHENQLLVPKFSRTLRGTTLSRVMTLANELVKAGVLKLVQEADLNVENLEKAKEVFMTGTTLDVLPVTRMEGKAIGSGRPGPVSQALLRFLRADMGL